MTGDAATELLREALARALRGRVVHDAIGEATIDSHR